MIIQRFLKKYISIQLAQTSTNSSGILCPTQLLKTAGSVTHFSQSPTMPKKCHLINSDHVLESSVLSDELDSDSL